LLATAAVPDFNQGVSERLLLVIGTVCPYSMRSRVYETVRCPSVRLSVLTWAYSSTLAAAGLLQAGRRYRSIAAVAAGECGQCHVVSVRR